MTSVPNEIQAPSGKMAQAQTFWDKQYSSGHDFGDQPSLTVNILAQRLESSNSSVLDIGHGPIPRDTMELVRQGHKVLAIEESTIASQKAMDLYDTFMRSASSDFGHADFMRADFKRAQTPNGRYDGANIHRVIHLVNPRNIPAFVNALTRAMKPNGIVTISARDPRDFDPKQMTDLGKGAAEVITRPGHIINFWDPQKFINFFKTQFNIIAFQEGSEPESNTKPEIDTHFLVMTAQKKQQPDNIVRITNEANSFAEQYKRAAAEAQFSVPTIQSSPEHRIFSMGYGFETHSLLEA